MKIVFMGTSAFAVPSLCALADSQYELGAVLTRPDRPAGRGLRPRPSAVKQAAIELRLPLLQPERIGSQEGRRALEQISPDLSVVVAYGQILPPEVLGIPPLGNINLHASLLPKYRGAAPLQRALMAGERQTGVTTLWMSEGLDEGDIIFQQALLIGEDETYGMLHDRLAQTGAQLLLETLDSIQRGNAPRRPQLPSLASYAPPIKPKEARISWSQSAAEIHNLVRALNPAPGAFCLWRGRRLKVWRVEKALRREGIPGEIVEFTPRGPLVASGRGGVILTEVQPEGRRRISGSEFVRGYRPRAGEAVE